MVKARVASMWSPTGARRRMASHRNTAAEGDICTVWHVVIPLKATAFALKYIQGW
jgi:hypothetical protein